MKANHCCGNCVICSTEALVGIEILNYSEVDAELIAMAQLGQPHVEVLQPTAGQLADLNDDGVGDISSDPSSDPPFDGRVARFIQLNLSPTLDNCLEGNDIVDITAEVTYTRTAQTPPTSSDDGSIGFANRITDTFLGTPTLIMGGADVVGATASVAFGVTKAELLTGGIVVLLGLQTQDGTLPVVNGIDWTNVSVVVSASTTVMCDAEAMRTVGCNDNAVLDLLEQIAVGGVAKEIRARQQVLSDGDTWPAALVDGKLQSYAMILTAGNMSSTDLVTATITNYPIGTYQDAVTGLNQTLLTPTYAVSGVGASVIAKWTEEVV